MCAILPRVASFTDAWIETQYFYSFELDKPSHLLQMRGLKQLSLNGEFIKLWSHLLQMRGLKPYKEGETREKVESHLLQMRGLKLDYK